MNSCYLLIEILKKVIEYISTQNYAIYIQTNVSLVLISRVRNVRILHTKLIVRWSVGKWGDPG